MDEQTFDRLARLIGTSGSRRKLVGLGAALPVAGLLTTLVDEAGEGRRRHGRNRGHRPGKRKKNRKGNRKGGAGNGRLGNGSPKCTNGCPEGQMCLSNGTCAVPCPNGDNDCSAAGCLSRCIDTDQGSFCGLATLGGSCNNRNADCPMGQACDGAFCETVCGGKPCSVPCDGGDVCLSNGTCATPCPNGGSDCSTAGCLNRCIDTDQVSVCVNADAQGDCNNHNTDCPMGQACAGAICETVC